jgi:fatty acid desaturase (delta-4 desaturase)
MPPDADKLRQRQGDRLVNDDDNDNVTSKTERTLESLKSHEVAIEGVVYDINSFTHPGGDSIHIFGGNDATTQYKMIHPYHHQKSSKHLEKMTIVGRIPNYQCE